MATSARRPVKKAVQSPKRRVAVPKPAAPVEPQVEEVESEDVEEEEVEGVNDEDTQEVPESIKQLAEDALAQAEEDFDLDSMPVLTIEMIRDAKDRTTQWLPVPEWGGKMQIKSLSAKAMFDMMGDDNAGITESGFTMDLSMVSMQKAIITSGVVQPVITDAAFEILMEKSTGPVMNLLQSIMRISKLAKGESGKDPVEEEVATFRPTGEQ